MSERFIRIFETEHNLYAEGAPVIVSAGALLKDKETGKILAQLKLKNISGKTIKNVSVKFTVMDSADRILDDKIEYTYLDLNTKNGEESGQKQPVLLPKEARSFKVSVFEVVFEDKSIWNWDKCQWNSMGNNVKVNDYFKKAKLVEQYGIECDSAVAYVPKRYADIWLCTCGEYNRAKHCHKCGLSIELMLEKLDKNLLEKNLDIRLKNEAYQEAVQLMESGKEYSSAEDIESAVEHFKKSGINDWKEKVQECEKIAQEINAKHKRNVKIGAIVVASVIAVILAIVLWTNVISPNIKYSKANGLYEEGKFAESMELFAELEDFRDSEKMYFEAKLGDALSMVDAEQFEEGIEIMREMTEAKERDCWGHMNESYHKWGLKLMEKKAYDVAIYKFRSCGGIKDASKYITYCEAAMLDESLIVERYELLRDIEGFLDVDSLIAAPEIQQALALTGTFTMVDDEDTKWTFNVENGRIDGSYYSDYADYYSHSYYDLHYNYSSNEFYFYWDNSYYYLVVDSDNVVTGVK